MHKTLVYIAGPTASGKTNVAIALAQWLQTEIISCDSRQFFAELKIGAAPPTPEEFKAVKHHFVQHLSVQQTYTAGQFEHDALRVLAQIFEEKNTAILVGGSGLYADALIKGFDVLPEADLKIREALKKTLQTDGIDALQELLRQQDPVYFATVDTQNQHRLIRALEVIAATGKPYSALRTGRKTRPFNVITIALDVPRDLLYARINQRVDAMVAAGLEAECRSLYPLKNIQALNTVGYKEFFAFFDGKIPHQEAINLIKQNTRRFAKRQLTWLRRDKNTVWFAPHQTQEMMDYIRQNATL